MAIDGDYRAGPLVAQERGTAVQHAAADLAAQVAPARDSGRALRLIGLVAVAVGLAALTAAACALSYSSIHHLAIESGVTWQLARIYPFIFDALLVIAGCSVLALRGAGLPSRIYAWFCLLVLLGALAAGGAVHAAAVHIPRKLAAIVAAVIPWALVLIGFGLLLALLRYARIRRPGKRRAEAETPLAGPAQGADGVVLSDVVITAEPPRHPAPPADAASGARGTQAPAALPVGPGAAGTPELATVPLPPVRELHRVEAGDPNAAGGPAREQPAPERPAPEQPAPRQPAPDAPASGQPPRPAVRPAEMQLRARIPRQPAEQAPADPVHSPFMPPVGPQPGRQQTNPRAEDHAAAAPTAPAAGESAEGGAAGETGQPGPLNPAPVDDELGEPPALRRPHSSPIPPGE